MLKPRGGNVCCTMVTQYRYHGNVSDEQMKNMVGEVI